MIININKMNFVCPICQSHEFDHQLTCKDFTVTKEEFNIVSCKQCGLFITLPHPDTQSISRYYSSDNYISHSDKKSTFLDKVYHLIRKYTIKQKVNLIKKYVPHGTILDMGCGTGYFLEECKKNGFKTFGIEPNELARESSEKKQITVFEDLDKFLNTNEKVHAATLWHVLEHIHYPEEVLTKLQDALSNKGILILALPNKNSFDANYYKNFWAGYDVPRHIYHFTKKDIKNIAKNKFHLIDIYPMFFDSFYVSILSEKYKGSRYSFIKGSIIGLYSNLNAIKTNEYSSLIYVLQKS